VSTNRCINKKIAQAIDSNDSEKGKPVRKAGTQSYRSKGIDVSMIAGLPDGMLGVKV
jgi:hypothetical protein